MRKCSLYMRPKIHSHLQTINPHVHIDNKKMSTNNSNDSSDNNSYFLRQQGLIYDEIDWPQPSYSSTSRTKNNTSSHHDGAPYSPSNNINVDAAWRTRDPLTNLLGTDASIIQSETGLTNIELSLLDGSNNNESNNDDEGGGHNQHTAESQFAASQVNIQSNILGPLLPTTDDNDDNEQQQLKKINVKVVKLAFDAASYAILTSEQKQRASILCSASTATTSSSSPRAQNNVIPSPSLSNHPLTATPIAPIASTDYYDPPLVLAMESIRTSRISNLREASNVGSLAIPQFLKKNATIPWFHLPCAVGGTALNNTTNNNVNTAVVANVAEKKKKKGGPSIVEGKEGDNNKETMKKKKNIIIKKRPVSSGGGGGR